jgi:CelD/BcsL family acetyltransferase involved in cellulose biosynthesis
MATTTNHHALLHQPVTVSADSDPSAAGTAVRLAGMAQQWRELARPLGPIEQHSWTLAAASTLAERDSLHLVSVEDDGKLAGVAPMVRRRRLGVEQAVLVGVDELHEPMDLPCRDAEAAVRLLRALVAEGRPLLFQRLPAQSPVLEALERIPRREAIALVRPGLPCPCIDLDGSWIEPELKLNSGRRSDLRRAKRRAEARGPVRASVHAPSQSELQSMLDTAIAVEARNWKGRCGTALVHDRQRQAFFRAYAAAAQAEGKLRICLLHIGDDVAAMQLAAVSGGGFWLLKIGYDDAFAPCSPGLLLMRETIRHAALEGLHRYEMLGLNAPWIEAWTRQQRQCVCVRIYPTRMRGLAALAMEATASGFRKLRGLR